MNSETLFNPVFISILHQPERFYECSLVCDRNYCNVVHFDKEEKSHEMFARLMREARCPCLWMSVAVL